MAQSDMVNDSFIRATNIIYMCDMTYLYVYYEIHMRRDRGREGMGEGEGVDTGV